jgi:subtilisin
MVARREGTAMHRWASVLVVLSLVAGIFGASGAQGARQGDDHGGAFAWREAPSPGAGPKEVEVAPGRYIVLLRPSRGAPQATAAELGRGFGLEVTHVYSRAARGFAAKIPAAKLEGLRSDPRVARIVPDRVVRANAEVLPRGVDRIGADTAAEGAKPTEAGAPVAVIDTGIARHRELNVVGGHNCTSDQPNAWQDGNGHGTHVAGIVGAKNNRQGVVGVAPGTPLYAVKVLNDRGFGLDSWIICGVEWVLTNAAAEGIVAANMSLGAFDPTEDPDDCASYPIHTAICNLVDAGVTVVVAAGNDMQDALEFYPAKYSQVVTVSALSDSDGCTGGVGPLTPKIKDLDDTLAVYSNWGETVDVAAPGTDIRSTWKNGGYETSSGTSMAAPHVTGAVALGWDPAGGERETTDPNVVDDDLDPNDPGVGRIWWDTEEIPFDPDGVNEGILKLSDNIGC